MPLLPASIQYNTIQYNKKDLSPVTQVPDDVDESHQYKMQEDRWGMATEDVMKDTELYSSSHNKPKGKNKKTFHLCSSPYTVNSVTAVMAWLTN